MASPDLKTDGGDLAIFATHKEDAIAADADADERFVAFLADVAVHAQGISGTVEVDNGRLSINVRKQSLQQVGSIGRKRRRSFVGVDLVRPVVLTTEGDPS